MANVLTGPVWTVDTPSGTALIPKGTPVHLKGVRWVGAAAAATVRIENASGDVIWASKASVADYVEADAPRMQIDGLIVPTLTSGTLYLELFGAMIGS